MNHGDHKRNPGRACTRCAATEARCAFTGKCCTDCSHFRHLDANGNEKPKPPPVVVRLDERRTCDTCGRRVSPRGRFDCPGLCSAVRSAYDRSRYRRRSA